MDKLKKFYAEHKDEILTGAYIAGSGAIILGAMAYLVKHSEIDRVVEGIMEEIDGNLVSTVRYESGFTAKFIEPIKK